MRLHPVTPPEQAASALATPGIPTRPHHLLLLSGKGPRAQGILRLQWLPSGQRDVRQRGAQTTCRGVRGQRAAGTQQAPGWALAIASGLTKHHHAAQTNNSAVAGGLHELPPTAGRHMLQGAQWGEGAALAVMSIP